MKRDKQKRATRRTGPDRTGQDRSEARTSKGAGAGLWAVVEGPHAVSVLLALGLAYRLALIAWLRDTPLWGSIELDHQTYDDWAQRIAGGELTSGHPFFVDPLYAYVLGAVYAVFGHGVLMPRLLQAVMGVATGYAVQQMTVEVGGSRRASVMALALYTFCVPVLFYELQLEKTCLAAALTAWSALVLIRMKRSKTPVRNATLAGVLLGLATLARSTSLVLLVVFAPFAWMQLRTAASSPGGVRPSTAGLLGVVAACLAVCSISFVHNLQAGDGIFLTANVGQNLMLSHDAENTTGTYSVLSFVRPDPRYEEDDFRAEALRRTGATEMSPSSVSAFYRDAALESLAADPARALRMLALRWYRLIQDYDIPDNVNLDVFREYLPTFGIRLPSWGLLLVLGVFGLAWSRRTLPGAGLLLGSVFVSLAAISCFFVVGRFRIPMIPFLCVGAGLGLEAGWALVRDAVPMRRAALAAGAIVLLGFVYYQPEWISAERARSEAVALNNLATSQLDAHHENEALETYARAIRTDSYSVPGALRISTDILLRRGEYARADELMQLLLAGRPEDRRALAMRVRIWEAAAAAGVPGASVELGNAREAAASAAASATDAVAAVDGAPGASATELYARSSALRREGRDREAITALQEAIRVGPYDENGRYLLGTLMEQHATAEEMLAYYQEARATDPKPQTSLYFWAVALERQGHVDEAIAKLGEALEVDPAHEMSEDRLGEIFRARGDLDQAEVHYRRALEIHPEFRTAWQHLGLLLRARHREEEATEADARPCSVPDPNGDHNEDDGRYDQGAPPRHRVAGYRVISRGRQERSKPIRW